MSKRVTSIVAVAALALAVTETTTTTEAFSTPAAFLPKTHSHALAPLFAEETKEASSESAFVPAEEEDDDDTLSAVEKLGRGAAKVSDS